MAFLKGLLARNLYAIKAYFLFNFQIPPEGYQLYDAVKMYALGVNKTVNKGYKVTNGSDVIQNMLNTEHTSI